MPIIIGEGGPTDKKSIHIETSKKRRIENVQYPQRAEEAMFEARKIHDNARRTFRSSRSTYNCVGMVFANRRTSIDPSQIPLILADDEYYEVEDQAKVAVGDIVIYIRDGSTEIQHIGVVVLNQLKIGGGRDLKVLSQFGRDGEYIHDLLDVPELYGSVVRFYSERRGGG